MASSQTDSTPRSTSARQRKWPASVLSQPPNLQETPWYRQTDDQTLSHDDWGKKQQQRRFGSQQEGLLELRPHQYDRVMGVGSANTSQDSL